MSSLLTFILVLAIGFITSYFAQQRGRNPIIWFLIGIGLGIFGFILLFIFPDLSKAAKQEKTYKPQEDKDTIEVSAEKVSSHPEDLSHDWFYLDTKQQQQGPMPFAALKKYWDEKRIDQFTYVWREGLNSWVRIENISELLKPLTGTYTHRE